MLRPTLNNDAPSRIIFFLSSCNYRSHVHQVQAQLIIQNLQLNTTIGSHFIDACQSLGLLSAAHELLFARIAKPHVFICNSLIRAYAHSRFPHFPFSIYAHMHRESLPPNNHTFPFLFKSLADFKELKKGLLLHTHVLKLGHLNDLYVGNSLLSLYCGVMGLCCKLFDEMPEKDVVSWTVLITGYRTAGKYDDALIAFERMQYAGVAPNRVTVVNALAACSKCMAIDMGAWIHGLIRRNGWELDVVLGTALIDMYGRCGKIEEGLSVFYSMREKNLFTWNVVIKGLATGGKGNEAVWWFYRMEQEGFEPDEMNLVAVLSACAGNSDLVDTGRQIFSSFANGKYRFSLNVKHYACIIDLLAGAGCLKEAFRVIREMPFIPTKFMWGSLLDGCRTHGNLELCEVVAKKLVELEKDNSRHYAVLCDIYADMGRWSDVENVRKMMKQRGFEMDEGCSSMKLEPQKQFSESSG